MVDSTVAVSRERVPPSSRCIDHHPTLRSSSGVFFFHIHRSSTCYPLSLYLFGPYNQRSYHLSGYPIPSPLSDPPHSSGRSRQVIGQVVARGSQLRGFDSFLPSLEVSGRESCVAFLCDKSDFRACTKPTFRSRFVYSSRTTLYSEGVFRATDGHPAIHLYFAGSPLLP